MALPQFTISELLQAGVHFGHRCHRWNPVMGNYIYGKRNGVHIIDLQQTVPLMYQALGTARSVAAKGGRVLFVGTKKQFQSQVAEAAERCGQYYINYRWLGGLLTNWKTIGQSIRRLKELDKLFGADADPAELEKVKRTKKELLMMRREHEKLSLALGGIKNMGGLPDVIIVMDVVKDRIAVEEAGCLGIPVIGILDTNSNPEGVALPIPGNDDSKRAVELYGRLMSDAILDGIAAHAGSGVARTATKSSATKKATAKKAEVKLSPKAEEAAKASEEKKPAVEKKATAKPAAKKVAKSEEKASEEVVAAKATAEKASTKVAATK